MLQQNHRHALTGARCKVLRCVEWGGPNRGPRRYRPPGTPYDQVVDQNVQGNATLTAGELSITSFELCSLSTCTYTKVYHAVDAGKAYARPQSVLGCLC